MSDDEVARALERIREQLVTLSISVDHLTSRVETIREKIFAELDRLHTRLSAAIDRDDELWKLIEQQRPRQRWWR